MNDQLFVTNTEENKIQIDPSKDYYSELVGEGKKFKDNLAAGRALVEKDAFIETLKAENAEYRERIRNSTSMDAFLDNLKKIQPVAPAAPTPETPSGQNAPENTQTKQGLTIEEVQALLAEREASKSAETNLQKSVAEAQKAFGANYKEVVSAKARELNLSQDFVLDVAKKSPAAFLQLIGADKVKPENPSLFPQTAVTSPVNTPRGTGMKWKDYEKIRKTDPGKYASLYAEIHNAAIAQGEDFFN